jgi:hypothetical protein
LILQTNILRGVKQLKIKNQKLTRQLSLALKTGTMVNLVASGFCHSEGISFVYKNEQKRFLLNDKKRFATIFPKVPKNKRTIRTSRTAFCIAINSDSKFLVIGYWLLVIGYWS